MGYTQAQFIGPANPLWKTALLPRNM